MKFPGVEGRNQEAKEAERLPVNAGLGVSDLVEAGHPEPIGTPALPFVHEVADSQYHLQHPHQTLAEDQLLGGHQDG